MGDHEMTSISSLDHGSSSKDSSEHVNRRHSRVSILHLAGFVFVLGFSFLVAGVVLLTLSQTRTSATKNTSSLNQTVTCNGNSSFRENNTKAENICAFSSEAKLAGKPIKCKLDYRCLKLKCFAYYKSTVDNFLFHVEKK